MSSFLGWYWSRKRRKWVADASSERGFHGLGGSEREGEANPVWVMRS